MIYILPFHIQNLYSKAQIIFNKSIIFPYGLNRSIPKFFLNFKLFLFPLSLILQILCSTYFVLCHQAWIFHTFYFCSFTKTYQQHLVLYKHPNLSYLSQTFHLAFRYLNRIVLFDLILLFIFAFTINSRNHSLIILAQYLYLLMDSLETI